MFLVEFKAIEGFGPRKGYDLIPSWRIHDGGRNGNTRQTIVERLLVCSRKEMIIEQL